MAHEQDLHWLPAWALREKIAKKEISPVELMRTVFARIARIDPQIHAFMTLCADEALAGAQAAEAQVMQGAPLGPLHGVPIVIKDEAWVAGVRVTAGSRLFKDFIPAEDGTCVRRLRKAGAIIVGMTNVPEFFSWSRCLNRLMPEAVNPWDVRRSPGASSGGTAAAIAAGIAPLGIGSDGGGSIRIPSALCGLVGLFPTPGRVPDTGSFSYARIGSLGPMARDVRDVALMQQIIAGPDGQDIRPAPPVPDVLAGLDEGVAGMRFAFTPDYGYIDVERGVAALVRGATEKLAGCGAVVDEPGLKFDNAWDWLGRLISGEIAYEPGYKPYLGTAEIVALRKSPEGYAQLTDYAQQAMQAPPITRQDYEKAKSWTADLKRKFQNLFERYDAILSPTLPVVAPVLPEGWADPYPEFCCGTYFTALANLAELPAASYPCGLADGLPVGLHIIARPGREDTVLRICRALETVLPFTAHPRLAFKA